MSFSKSLSKVASKIIKKFGVECTFTRYTKDAFDPATGLQTITETTFEGYGVKDKFKKNEVNGEAVLFSDIKLILEKTDTVPVIGDECAINGSVSYRVMDVTPIDPAHEDIIYEVQLRV